MLRIIILLLLPFIGFNQERVLIDIDTEKFDSYDQYQPFTGQKSSLLKSTIDLRSFCPSILNQGNTGACASYATAYGALTIGHAIQNQITSKTLLDKLAFSPSFLYNQILKENDECTQPTDLLDYIDLLKNIGVCFNSDFPNSENCKLKPDTSHYKKALNFKIDHGAVLFKSSRNDTFKIGTIKNFLNDSIPVVAVIQVYDTFYEATKPFWKKGKYDNYLGGHHVVVVIGYDETTGSFDIMNSWGDQWGDKGFIKIPFLDFVSICPSALVIEPGRSQLDEYLTLDNHKNNTSVDEELLYTILKRTRNQQKYVRNKFEIYEVSKIDEKVVKQKAPIYMKENGNYYTRGIKLKDAIQIKTSTITKGSYTYIYSLNEHGHLNQHWPRESDSKNVSNQVNLSPLSINYITIPSKESVLVKSSNKEELIVISSSQELIGLEDILISRSNLQNLKEVLSEKYFHNSELLVIEFEKSNLEANAIININSDFIIPLVVSIE